MIAVSRPGGERLGDRIEVAGSFLSRLKGLLGRAGLSKGEGLLLDPCASVHTCFMRFPIDLCFLDGEWRVLKAVQGLTPWRWASALGAARVLELPAGTLARAGVREGEVLVVSG